MAVLVPRSCCISTHRLSATRKQKPRVTYLQSPSTGDGASVALQLRIQDSILSKREAAAHLRSRGIRILSTARAEIRRGYHCLLPYTVGRLHPHHAKRVRCTPGTRQDRILTACGGDITGIA